MKESSKKFVLVIAFGTFLVSGLFNGAIGPVLSELSSQTHSSLSAAGGVISFLFIGALITQVIGGPIADRIGLKAVLVSAFLLLAVGLVGFSVTQSQAGLYFFFLVAGLGQGCQNLGTNLIIAKTFPEKSTSYLNLLHFFFGIGAFSSPALVSLVLTLNQPGVLVHQITAGLFVVISMSYLLFYRNVRPEKKSAEVGQKNTANLYRSPLVWTLGVLLLVYVGVEYGMGSWSTTLMTVTANWPTERGALITSAYWGFFTLGRFSGAFLSRKLTIHKLLFVSIIGALLCGIAFTALLGSTAGMIAALLALGLCCGPIFPTTVSFASKAYPQDQGKAVGLVGAMSSIGGLSVPLLDGIFLENNQAFGYAVFNTALLVVLLGLFGLARKLSADYSHQI